MANHRKYTNTEKYCPRCKQWKIHDDFHKHKGTRGGGLNSLCKSCAAEYSKPYRKKYHKNHREHIIEKSTKWNRVNAERRMQQKCNSSDRLREIRYGLTPEKYKELYDFQNGKCGIASCGNLIEHVDHDHETKIVRGLLCVKCNLALGLFRDNSQILRDAADYLDKTGLK